MAASLKKPARNGTIDLMKFLFCLLIMLFHTTSLFPGGYIAVEFFFITSGYLMALSMDREKDSSGDIGTRTVRFILHKACGIFPYYAAAWVLSFLLTIVVKNYTFSQLFRELFMSPYNFFMVEMAGNYDMGHRIEGSWYISAMLLAMAVLYPVRTKSRNLFDGIIAPLLALFAVGYFYQRGKGLSATVYYDSSLHMYTGLLRALTEIPLGCLCYRLRQRLLPEGCVRPGGLRSILLAIPELFGYAVTFYCAHRTAHTSFDLALLFWLSVSVTISFSGCSITAKYIRGDLFRFLGTFSLMIYLTHQAVKKQILIPLGLHTLPLPLYLLLLLAVSSILGWICYAAGNFIRRMFRKDPA